MSLITPAMSSHPCIHLVLAPYYRLPPSVSGTVRGRMFSFDLKFCEPRRTAPERPAAKVSTSYPARRHARSSRRDPARPWTAQSRISRPLMRPTGGHSALGRPSLPAAGNAPYGPRTAAPPSRLARNRPRLAGASAGRSAPASGRTLLRSRRRPAPGRPRPAPAAPTPRGMRSGAPDCARGMSLHAGLWVEGLEYDADFLVHTPPRLLVYHALSGLLPLKCASLIGLLLAGSPASQSIYNGSRTVNHEVA